MLKSIRRILAGSMSSKTGGEYASPALKPIESGHAALITTLNDYFNDQPVLKSAYEKELNFLGELPETLPDHDRLLHSILPYSFTEKYSPDEIDVFRDSEAGMFYVLLDGKRLYYPKSYTSTEAVQKSFTYLLAEQDLQSPHRYLSNAFVLTATDTILDLGAAEGNFSLMVVEKVKALIIVESNGDWIKALEKTFSPWKEKVTIINKYVSSEKAEFQATLNELTANYDITAIKMDIEGAEFDVLMSGSLSLVSRHLKLAVATYHRQDDATNIKLLLESFGYTTSYSQNSMLFIYDILQPPYFRKVLLYAHKRQNNYLVQ